LNKLFESHNMQDEPLIGVLALQGAFEEHQKCLEAVGCRTRQVSFLSKGVATQNQVIESN
jgi:glutamine amidotransferase PdxT